MSRIVYHKRSEARETHNVVWGWRVRVHGCSLREPGKKLGDFEQSLAEHNTENWLLLVLPALLHLETD